MTKMNPATHGAAAAPLATPLARRSVLVGAGATGALAAVAALLPATPPAAQAVLAAAAPPVDADGYQLTDHVKRYYATTRL
jgi:hypothetical protein